MISISITVEAYQAIKATMPRMTDDSAPARGPHGLIRVWLDRKFVDRLGQNAAPLRGL